MAAPPSMASDSSHSSCASQATISDAQSSPRKPGSIFRSGLTAQSVSAATACPSGLRNGARNHCMMKRSSAEYTISAKTILTRKRSASASMIRVQGSDPKRSPISRARAAAALTAAMIAAITPASSIALIARSVVPPLDVTWARSSAGFGLALLGQAHRSAESRVSETTGVGGLKPELARRLLERFEKIEDIRGTAARDGRDGIELVLTFAPKRCADGFENGRGAGSALGVDAR